ncbi:MAG: GNAT family protein [Methylovirgula sp.]
MPTTVLGKLGVDKDYRRRGHASSLLLFALKSASYAAEIVGSMGAITHPLDDEVRRFYALGNPGAAV